MHCDATPFWVFVVGVDAAMVMVVGAIAWLLTWQSKPRYLGVAGWAFVLPLGFSLWMFARIARVPPSGSDVAWVVVLFVFLAAALLVNQRRALGLARGIPAGAGWLRIDGVARWGTPAVTAASGLVLVGCLVASSVPSPVCR